MSRIGDFEGLHALNVPIAGTESILLNPASQPAAKIYEGPAEAAVFWGNNVKPTQSKNVLRSHAKPLSSTSMSDPTREEIDAKIGASEARTDTKFALLDGRLDVMLAKMDGISTQLSDMRADNHRTRGTVRNSGFALAGLIVGIAALLVAGALTFPAAFDLGLSARDLITREMQQATPTP